MVFKRFVMLSAWILAISPVEAGAQSKLPIQNAYTIYQIRLPNTGFLEVSLEPTHWTTRAVLEFEEFADLKTVDIGKTSTFTISKPQVLSFQLINEPTNDNAFWTLATTPSASFSMTQQGWQTDSYDYSAAGGGIVHLRYRYAPLQFPAGKPLLVCQGGQGPYVGPFERGLCSTTQCSQFSGWVRGRADLNVETGQVAMLLQLETDAVDVGPKGIMVATFSDVDNKTIATITSKEVGVGGKAPGHARIENVPAVTTLPVDIAKRVARIGVRASCTGYVEKWFNLFPGKLEFTYTIHM